MPGIRRLLLQTTSYHLYFLVQADRVHVVWFPIHDRGVVSPIPSPPIPRA